MNEDIKMNPTNIKCSFCFVSIYFFKGVKTYQIKMNNKRSDDSEESTQFVGVMGGRGMNDRDCKL